VSEVEKSRAVLLRRHDFSETSFIVSLITPAFGLLRALAKGAKRARSPMQGALEPLTLADVVFYRKRPPALHILSQAKTVAFWRGLRTDLDRFYAAHRVAEILLAGVPEELPQKEVFDLAVSALQRLDDRAQPHVALTVFEAGLLKAMGSFPRVETCLACEKPLDKGEDVLFHPPSGGAFHLRCAGDKASACLEVGAGILQLIKRFADERVPRLDRVSFSPAVARRMRAFLDAYFRFLLERDLRTSRFVRA